MKTQVYQRPTPNLNRRAFLQGTTLMLTCPGMVLGKSQEVVRVGLVTDIHYADKNTGGSRHYRDSKLKLREAVSHFNKEKPAFVIELGDFIDRAKDVETELQYLKVIEKEYSQLQCDRYYVLGNHCLDTLSKEEFIANTGMDAPHYSFDKGGFHFVALDACFNSKGEPYQRRNFVWNDANISDEQLKWLEQDLRSSGKPTVVFTHQRLDPSGNYMIKNAEAVRNIMEKAGNVQAVFSGHSHKNEHKIFNGIHYCVVRAVVEGPGEDNNGYGMLSLHCDGKLAIEGFRKQKDYSFSDA